MTWSSPTPANRSPTSTPPSKTTGSTTTAARREITTAGGDRLRLGDRVATRRNDPDLQVANRQTWTVTGIGQDGSLVLHSQGRDRKVPAEYASRFVELAYATTVHGAQGDTVDAAHVLIGDTSGAASAYVAMTRGREHNTAHLVAEDLDDARRQWVEVFGRDRADLGPAHARTPGDRGHRPLRHRDVAAAPAPPPRPATGQDPDPPGTCDATGRPTRAVAL